MNDLRGQRYWDCWFGDPPGARLPFVVSPGPMFIVELGLSQLNPGDFLFGAFKLWLLMRLALYIQVTPCTILTDILLVGLIVVLVVEEVS